MKTALLVSVTLTQMRNRISSGWSPRLRQTNITSATPAFPSDRCGNLLRGHNINTTTNNNCKNNNDQYSDEIRIAVI